VPEVYEVKWANAVLEALLGFQVDKVQLAAKENQPTMVSQACQAQTCLVLQVQKVNQEKIGLHQLISWLR